MTTTPRTDAAHRKCSGLFRAASAANGFLLHARQLETELAELRKAVQFVIDHAGKTHATECGELQCGPLWMAEQLGCALDATKGKT